MGADQLEAKRWVIAVFETLTDEVMVQDKINIMNFGTFKRKIRKPKKRLDCNTGLIVIDPSKTAVTFSPSDFLKYRVAEEAPLEKE